MSRQPAALAAKLSTLWALEQQGVNNLVVVPKAMGQGGQKEKTDRRDSVQLCDNLDRYLGGNTKALSVVAVPSA
jgi:hypothetical protein